MPREPQAALRARSATVFAALGDSHRLELLNRLASKGAQSITALTADANVTRQAITKQLHVLESAGLVRGHREGRQHVWMLSPRGLREASAHLDAIERQWARAIERLRAYVEE